MADLEPAARQGAATTTTAILTERLAQADKAVERPADTAGATTVTEVNLAARAAGGEADGREEATTEATIPTADLEIRRARVRTIRTAPGGDPVHQEDRMIRTEAPGNSLVETMGTIDI
jgi:hypothetical protein